MSYTFDANVLLYASDETSERFWPVYGRVSREADACGNLVPDAHLVALMVENGVRTIWTHDRDYSTAVIAPRSLERRQPRDRPERQDAPMRRAVQVRTS